MNKKYDYEYVKEYIKSFNCELLDSIYISDRTKMKVMCSCGNNEWMVTFHNFKIAPNCILCRNKKIRKKLAFSFDYVKEYIESYEHILLSTNYKNNSEKLNIKCRCGNSNWWVTFSSFKDNSKLCPLCSRSEQTKNQSFSTEYIREKISEYGFSFTGEYINNHEKITIIDSNNYLYYISYVAFYNTIIINKQNLEFVSSTNIYSYDNIQKYIENNKLNFSLLDGNYMGTHQKTLVCECKKCFEKWDNTWHNIQGGIACPYCDGKKVSIKNSFGSVCPYLICDWDYEKNKKSPFEYMPQSNAKVFWICGQCGEKYSQKISKKYRGHGCKICNMSGGAKRVYCFLKENNIAFDYDIPKFDDLLGDYKKLRYDFILYNDLNKNDISRIIEFDGRQHEVFIYTMHKNLDAFEKVKRYDAIKDEYAKKNNIPLIRIKEREFNNIETILYEKLSLERKEVIIIE